MTGSHSVALSGLALPEILLLLPPKNWDLRRAPAHLEEWLFLWSLWRFRSGWSLLLCRLSGHHCVQYIPCCCHQMLEKKPLKEGRDCCDSQFEGTVHHGSESMGAGTVCSCGSRNLQLLAHISVDSETQRRMSVPTFSICTI